MFIKGLNITVGADPEFFVADKGVLVSAHNLIKGDKMNPFKVDNGAVQVDGIAAEFNIDPSNSYEEFQGNIDSVMETLSEMIGDKELLNAVSVDFDEKFMESIPQENLELGCEADYNGWTGQENVKPEAGNMMRTAGGHVHIGGFYDGNAFDTDHFKTCMRMSRLMDEELGVYSILWDKDDKRRSMYGKAGCFRPKKYGMEYRTLSNAWLYDKNKIKFVYNAVERVIERMFRGEDASPDVQDVINKSDRSSPMFNDNKLVGSWC